jgi:hypothetical protein
MTFQRPFSRGLKPIPASHLLAKALQARHGFCSSIHLPRAGCDDEVISSRV